MKYLLIGFLLVVKIFCVESCASKEASSESAETREHPPSDQSTPLASRKKSGKPTKKINEVSYRIESVSSK